MSKYEKQLEQLGDPQRDASWNFTKLCQVLQRLGFEMRISGRRRHGQFQNPKGDSPSPKPVWRQNPIGKHDMEANAISVRVHCKGNLGAKPRAEAIAEIVQSIRERRA